MHRPISPIPPIARRAIALVAVAIPLAGCGDGLRTVGGRVLLDGEPAPEGVRVIFSALGDTMQADGIVDAAGRFELRTRSRDGVMPGRYKVILLNSTKSVPVPTVPIPEGVTMPPPEWMAYDRKVAELLGNPPQGPGWIPVSYASPETTTLTFDVPGDGRDALIEVSSAPQTSGARAATGGPAGR
jgi:hypothetical protein